jgi:hypothetical protein
LHICTFGVVEPLIPNLIEEMWSCFSLFPFVFVMYEVKVASSGWPGSHVTGRPGLCIF